MAAVPVSGQPSQLRARLARPRAQLARRRARLGAQLGRRRAGFFGRLSSPLDLGWVAPPWAAPPPEAPRPEDPEAVVAPGAAVAARSAPHARSRSARAGGPARAELRAGDWSPEAEANRKAAPPALAAPEPARASAAESGAVWEAFAPEQGRVPRAAADRSPKTCLVGRLPACRSTWRRWSTSRSTSRLRAGKKRQLPSGARRPFARARRPRRRLRSAPTGANLPRRRCDRRLPA